MKPVFIDFHIHTLENPEHINASYDVNALKSKIESISDGADYLISLTDHNVINKSAYLNAVTVFDHILLGVELHVRNYDKAVPYHCHILFNIGKIDESVIDELNVKLDHLYPRKSIENNDESIPKLEAIMNCFDDYEFVLLPHGGQNHSTFDKSIPDGVQFDKTLERSIYYNHFDGFTARSNSGLDKTQEYFSRLGIKDFVNLVTATDNYDLRHYPNCKAGKNASEFIPTWMLASPTFDGLRLSLSESTRLLYGAKPDIWSECIEHVHLKNENIDIDIDLTPGLNVVIGGSSSGKSLLVDSMYRKIIGDFDGSVYLATPYNVNDIEVTNPTGQHPHYLDQNYIGRICDPKDKEHRIDDISILKSVFPSDRDELDEISNGLSDLNVQLNRMMQSVKEIDKLQNQLSRIPKLSHLIVTEAIHANPLKPVKPDPRITNPIEYSRGKHQRYLQQLDEIDRFLDLNPLINHDTTLVEKLIAELQEAYRRGRFELTVRDIITNEIKEVDKAQDQENRETTTKRNQFEDLLEAISAYARAKRTFYSALNRIASYKIRIKTKEIESMGHKLYIENAFELTKEKFHEVVDDMLKREHKLNRYDDICPDALFERKFRKKEPKVLDYDDFTKRVSQRFSALNKKTYRITTKEGNDFENLSAGWKTSVILDLILGWESDNAALIIDQPEDNLATNYINHGLLSAIKQCKSKKQIILVSHNATIPMLGDAQNVILCKNTANKITIRSNPLEGNIDGQRVVDHIAKITDGGKASIKKRVKKYNLKNFREGNP